MRLPERTEPIRPGVGPPAEYAVADAADAYEFHRILLFLSIVRVLSHSMSLSTHTVDIS